MNKKRRELLAKISNDLEALYIKLESIKEEEEECRDNIPDNLQGTERYEKSDAAVDNLDDALNSLQETLDSINEAKGEE